MQNEGIAVRRWRRRTRFGWVELISSLHLLAMLGLATSYLTHPISPMRGEISVPHTVMAAVAILYVTKVCVWTTGLRIDEENLAFNQPVMFRGTAKENFDYCEPSVTAEGDVSMRQVNN